MWPLQFQFLLIFMVWKLCKCLYGPQPQGRPRTSWKIGLMESWKKAMIYD